MWHKIRIHFNSSILSAFFILTSIGFTLLLFAIWSVSVRDEKIANLKHDENFIMSGITGTILGSAELDYQGLPQQSHALIQDYLNYIFDSNKNAPQLTNVSRIAVYSLKPQNQVQIKQLIGEWISDLPVSRECIERRTEYFPVPKSQNTYLIDLSLNSCADSNISLLEYHTISTPILISLAIIFIWGLFIHTMLKSVSYAGKLLSSSGNTSELLDQTDRIRWTNVGTLTQRALQVRGKNLQYYQTIVLDAQHDISKILDVINRDYQDKILNQNINIIRGIIHGIAAEVRSSDGNIHDITKKLNLNEKDLEKILRMYYPGNIIKNELPNNLCLQINDVSLFERILINLASNAAKHSIDDPIIKIFYENKLFKLRVITPISEFTALKLKFARITNRIDVKNPESPVYIKLFGRTGRGLSIVKRGILKLGGQLIFSIGKNIVESGIDLPASLIENTIQPDEAPKAKKRVISFKNQEFIDIATERGLKDYIVSEIVLQQLISQGINLEVVTDYEIVIPSNCTLRIIAKKERIEGIALNWLPNRLS